MKGRFLDTWTKEDSVVNQVDWINNSISPDFNRLLAQVMLDLMGNPENMSKLGSHGFYMAVGPVSSQNENAIAEFKKNLEAMEKLAAAASNENQTNFYKGKFQGRTEYQYTTNNRVYYAIRLSAADLSLNQRQLTIEAALDNGNSRTSGLKIGEFGIYTKYPAGSQNIFLLNYGRHSEIRKDDDLTLSRKIEFLF